MSKKTNLPDAKFEELKAKLNDTIHELVFAVHHLEEDEIEAAQNSLMTAGMTIEEVALEVVAFGD